MSDSRTCVAAPASPTGAVARPSGVHTQGFR